VCLLYIYGGGGGSLCPNAVRCISLANPSALLYVCVSEVSGDLCLFCSRLLVFYYYSLCNMPVWWRRLLCLIPLGASPRRRTSAGPREFLINNEAHALQSAGDTKGSGLDNFHGEWMFAVHNASRRRSCALLDIVSTGKYTAKHREELFMSKQNNNRRFACREWEKILAFFFSTLPSVRFWIFHKKRGDKVDERESERERGRRGKIGSPMRTLRRYRAGCTSSFYRK